MPEQQVPPQGGDDPVAAYLKKYGKQKATRDTVPVAAPRDAIPDVKDPVDAYLKRYMTDEAEKQRPGIFSKTGSVLTGLLSAPVESAVNTIAPTKAQAADAEADPDFQARMIARFGREAHPRGVTGKERVAAIAQTAANLAAPGIIKAMPRAGVSLSGAIQGAAYDPEKPVRGALIGGSLGLGLTAAPAVGGKILDVTGARPHSYSGTPQLATAIGDASEAMSPGLATRDVTNPPPANVGRRLLKSAARAVGVESAEQRAVSFIARAMERDGLTLEQAAQKASGAFGMQPNTLMELAGRNTMRLGRSALTAPGPGSDIMASRIGDRALGEEDRMIEHLLNSGQSERVNVPRTLAALHDEASNAASPLYNKLRESAPQDMEKAAPYMERPAFQTGYEHAARVAANEGKTLPALFEDVKNEAGKVVGKKLRPMDFETVDRVKRALDDVLYDAERPMPSELASKSGGLSNDGRRVIEKARNEFVALADEAFPGYAEARDAYAGPTALRRATEKGQKVLTMTPDEIAEFKGSLSASERQSFQRSGLEAFIANRIESTAPGTDVTRQVAKTRDKKRLAQLFDSPEELHAFGERAADMARRFRTRNFLGGQSQTADKLAELAELSGFSLDDVADLAMGNAGGFLRRTAARIAGKGQAGVTEATGEAIAKRLTAGATPEGMTLQQVLDEIKSYGEGQGSRQTRKVIKSSAAGLTSSQIPKN